MPGHGHANLGLNADPKNSKSTRVFDMTWLQTTSLSVAFRLTISQLTLKESREIWISFNPCALLLQLVDY